MDRLFLFLFTLLLLGACDTPPESPAASAAEVEADSIVNRAIARHGGDVVRNSRIAFDFRKYHFEVIRRGDQFRYERSFSDTLGRSYRDVLTNDGFFREIDGNRQALSAKDSSAYANSVNSVVYFTLLPYFLTDPAAQRSYLGEGTVNGEPYHKIGVTFRQAGGGKDYQDEFVYWFHRDRNTLDYLAYNYLTDGGGARFREAYHPRETGGIRFQDYYNYQPLTDTRAVETFDQLFEADSLKLLSEIRTEQPQVEVFSPEQ